MNHLTRNDYADALRLIACLEPEACDLERFARSAVSGVNRFVASGFAILSVCDLVTGHRQVVGLPGAQLGARDIARFDRHFFEHPLVPYHGIEYAAAVPLFMDGRTLVTIVLNRRGRDFSERDRERLELLRPHLAFLYRHACGATAACAMAAPPPLAPARPDPEIAELTLREREVMLWLACGKTNAEIAALLSISPRTVHKHLEHIYVKLGVETRTAAVMRALAMHLPDGSGAPGATWRVSRTSHSRPA